MSQADDILVGAEQPEDGGADQRLQFRVLMIGGARKAFRLESVFWEALETFARRNGHLVAAEVEARLAAADSEQLNQSASLRASLMAELMVLWKKADARSVRPKWANVIAVMPAPAFVASRASKLLAANQPMLSFLEGRNVDPASHKGPEDGYIVELPPSAIVEAIGSSRRPVVICVASFRVGRRRLNCKVRLIGIEGPEGEPPTLLGFVEPS